MKLRCINIVTADLTRMKNFYSKVFETPAEELVPGRYELWVDGVCLVFTHTDTPIVINPDSCGLEFEVEDVDSEYSRLQAVGVAIPEPPVTYPWGWRAFGFQDPDGNNIDFVKYVGQDGSPDCGREV